MRKSYIVFTFITILTAISGCSKIGFLTTAIFHRTRPITINISNGYLEYYSFTLGDEDKIETYLFFIGGSGHASAQFYRHYLKDLPGNVKVFTLQKRYVKHWSTGMSKPSTEFIQRHCLSNWLQDQNIFIKHIIDRERLKGKPIVVFGVSEGAGVAVVMAARVPEITHLVVLGSGGMKGIDSFRIWGKKYRMDFDKIYAHVNKNPDSKRVIEQLGWYSYKYWKEILDFDPMVYLAKLDIPILFAKGSKDDMSPVESLYYLQTEFEKLNKQNLTTVFYKDCNHILVDSKGDNHREDFLQDISSWIGRTTPQDIGVDNHH